MKLSNKILLGFFGFLFLYLTAVFAELRLTGTPNFIDEKNSISESVDISGITHLVLNDIDKDLQIRAADSSVLQVRSISGDILKRLKYRISGDTLTISALKSQDVKNMKITFFVRSGSLKAVTANSCRVTINSLQQEALTISQTASNVWMSDNSIGKIQSDLTQNSFLSISSPGVNTLSLNIKESEMQVWSPVGLVEGSMKDKSSLRLTQIEEITLKKDMTSTLSIY
jgi:hypothetical protein